MVDSVRPMVFLIFLLALLIKIYLFVLIINRGIKNPDFFKKFLLLCGTLFCAIFSDCAWILCYIRCYSIYAIEQYAMIFIIRIAWALCFIQYQSFGIFIESLVERDYLLPKYQRLLLFFNSCCAAYFVYNAFFNMHHPRHWVEICLLKLASFVVCILLLTVLFVLRKVNKVGYPKILKQQLIILLKFVICPLICMELFLGIYAVTFYDTQYIASAIVTIIFTFAIHRVYKIICLRFLNFNIRDSHKFIFFKKFQQAVANLSNITHIEQLELIVQMSFKDIFAIEPNYVRLYFRQSSGIREVKDENNNRPIKKIEFVVEAMLDNESELHGYIRGQRIIIYDEIIFNNTYQASPSNTMVIDFLNALNADVFIPIFKANSLAAYIIIERNARGEKLFNDIECDEMILYVASLENVINIFQNHKLSMVVEREKKLHEELFLKHQEINQCREALEAFSKLNRHRIGIITYTSYRKFVYLNQDVKELMNIDLNTQVGHRLTKEFQEVAKDVLQYKAVRTKHTFDERGEKIVIRAVPYLDKNNVLLMVYYSEIMDSVKQVQDALGKPTGIDYLLYLETTSAGKLINKLIPNAGAVLIQFKINLLECALSKKALVIDVPDEDEVDLVDILHAISMRDSLKVLKIEAETSMITLAKNLFGINKMYEATNDALEEKPLLESLHTTGTLFIKNIHLLSLELQDMLAEYIRYGYYRVYKSDQKFASSVRIICSTRYNLSSLVLEKKFSKALFEELKQTHLIMPSLADISDAEYSALLQNLTDQVLATSQVKELFEFTDVEKMKLISERSISLKQLKNRIESMLSHKFEQRNLSIKTIYLDGASTLNDAEYAKASKLGKNALKDVKTLEMLIKKFKTQSKVAEFLGVHRSAVYKRLKKFNLLENR